MNNFSKQAYLSRPLVEDVAYDIKDTSVHIHCPHTCFVNISLPDYLQKNELLAQRQRLIFLAQERGTRVSFKNHIKKTIMERWPEYENAYKAQKDLFCQLVAKAKAVQQRGIHFGCSDDEELNAITSLQNQLLPFGYRNSVSSVFRSFHKMMTNLEQGFAQKDWQYDMIIL